MAFRVQYNEVTVGCLSRQKVRKWAILQPLRRNAALRTARGCHDMTLRKRQHGHYSLALGSNGTAPARVIAVPSLSSSKGADATRTAECALESGES